MLVKSVRTFLEVKGLRNNMCFSLVFLLIVSLDIRWNTLTMLKSYSLNQTSVNGNKSVLLIQAPESLVWCNCKPQPLFLIDYLTYAFLRCSDTVLLPDVSTHGWYMPFYKNPGNHYWSVCTICTVLLLNSPKMSCFF